MSSTSPEGNVNQAVRLHGPLDLRLSDEPSPHAGPGEHQLRITAVGLCGSDRHHYLEGGIGGTPNDRALVLGHEVGGVVVGGERGGARVAIDPAIPCGACATCRDGLGHLCPDLRFAGQDSTDGGLQRSLTWPADRCVRVPDAMPNEEVPLLEVLGIAVHAMDLAGAAPGMRAGVFGCGPVGLVIIRALRASGVEIAIATDRLSSRLAAASESGAKATVLIGHDATTIRFPSVDIAFECAGEAAATDDAVAAVVPGGSVLLVGIPEGARASHAASPARRKEIGLKWVRRMADGDLERAVHLVDAGHVSFAGLVTARYDLTEFDRAFAALAARTELKVVVTPTAADD